MKSIWVVAHDPAVAASMVAGVQALGAEAGAVVFGGDAVPGANLTLVVPAPGPGVLIESYAQPVADWLKQRNAELVLVSTDTQSRLLAGMLAAHIGTSVRNVSSISLSADTVSITRPVYGGLAQAAEELPPSGSAVLVMGAGVLPEAEPATGGGATETLTAAPAGGLRIREIRPKQTQPVNLAAAKKVVGVGRGFAAEADLDLARQLADKLGAEIACSRPMAEGVGWMPVERYLGVSGATIKPDVYVAVGISGQVQHMVGVNRAKTIVAINTDKNAPIFAQADYGIAGSLYEVLPALTAAL